MVLPADVTTQRMRPPSGFKRKRFQCHTSCQTCSLAVSLCALADGAHNRPTLASRWPRPVHTDMLFLVRAHAARPPTPTPPRLRLDAGDSSSGTLRPSSYTTPAAASPPQRLDRYISRYTSRFISSSFASSEAPVSQPFHSRFTAVTQPLLSGLLTSSRETSPPVAAAARRAPRRAAPTSRRRRRSCC